MNRPAERRQLVLRRSNPPAKIRNCHDSGLCRTAGPGTRSNAHTSSEATVTTPRRRAGRKPATQPTGARKRSVHHERVPRKHASGNVAKPHRLARVVLYSKLAEHLRILAKGSLVMVQCSVRRRLRASTRGALPLRQAHGVRSIRPGPAGNPATGKRSASAMAARGGGAKVRI